LDLANYFFRGFVDDHNVTRPATQVQRSVPTDQLVFSAARRPKGQEK
jgi:hypothetical protein